MNTKARFCGWDSPGSLTAPLVDDPISWNNQGAWFLISCGGQDYSWILGIILIAKSCIHQTVLVRNRIPGYCTPFLLQCLCDS